MKNIFKIVSQLTILSVLIGGFFWILHNMQSSDAASDQMDFEVSAQCLPHSEINIPSFLQMQYGFVGDAQGSVVHSLLRTGSEDIPHMAFRFGTPQRGWVSMIFPGPAVQANLYCQSSSSTQSFYLSGDRFSRMKLYLSRDGGFSEEELASTQMTQKTELRVTASGESQNQFRFGHNMENPYWLQFAVPVHEPVSLQGNLNIEVR